MKGEETGSHEFGKTCDLPVTGPILIATKPSSCFRCCAKARDRVSAVTDADWVCGFLLDQRAAPLHDGDVVLFHSSVPSPNPPASRLRVSNEGQFRSLER